jgi:hypothetical protein
MMMRGTYGDLMGEHKRKNYFESLSVNITILLKRISKKLDRMA